MERKVFYTIQHKKGILGIEQKDGFEFEINNKKFNGYVNEYGDAHIIDPETGLSLYRCYVEDISTEIGRVKYAVDKLLQNKDKLQLLEEIKSSEVYQMMIDMFNAFKKGVELSEKIKALST